MKPPKHVQIGPYDWRVRVDLDALRVQMVNRHSHLLGSTVYEDLEILISPDQAKSLLSETLLHEVLHAILYVSDSDCTTLTPEIEEAAIRLLSPLLLDTLRRNPALVDYLLDE